MKKEGTSKRKILFILSFPPPYHGANLSNKMIWESDVQRVFSCCLVDISDKRDLNNLGAFDFTNVFLALKHLFIIFQKIIINKPDAVYLLISQNNWAVVRDCSIILLVKVFSKAKVIIHLRGAFFKSFYDNTNPLMKLLVAFTMKKVSAAIVLGNNLRFNFEKWCKNIFVVPNGTDILTNFSIEQKTMLKQSGEIVITFMSNFFSSKGFYEVLESIKTVVESCPEINIRYKLAGAWGADSIVNLNAEDIKNKSSLILDRDNTNKFVDFMGVLTGESKLNLLKQTDIFVLPTSYDGQPRSIIEAMAAGCCIISTPVGAIAETISDGETGFIIEPRNSKVLAEKIIRIVKDNTLRNSFFRASRNRYNSHFTKDKFIGKFIQTLHTIIQQN